MATKRSEASMVRQLNQLSNQIKALQTSRPKRKRPRANKTQGPRSEVLTNAGGIKVSNAELLATDVRGKNGVGKIYSLGPVSSNMGHYKALALIYERYRFLSLRIEYVAAIGTTVGGVVTVGMDYDGTMAIVSQAKVSSLNPSFSVPVHRNRSMTIPPKFLNPQKWLSTRGESEAHPGAIVVWCTSNSDETLGLIRCHYTVEFAGPELP